MKNNYWRLKISSNYKIIPVMALLMLFFFQTTSFSQWQIVYSDQLINELREQGINYQKRQGHFSTEAECLEMIERAVIESGDPYIRNKMSCEGCDETSGNSGSTGYVQGSSGSGDFNQQLVQSVVAPLIQGLFDWIFSPSTDDNSSSHSNTVYTTSPPTEEEIRLYKEKQEKWIEQVKKVQAEYSEILSKKFSDQKKNIANDFNNRTVKSEAIKNIKQLNCAANQSIEAAETVLQGKNNFKDLEGSLEDMRSLSDFTEPDCPKIKYEIPDVTVSNPIGFQQMIYQTVKYKADSIGVNLTLLKEKETIIKKVIEEKKQVVEEIKLKPQGNNDDDQLLKDAIDALNESIEEGDKVNDELVDSKISLEKLENIRSTYDLEKPPK